MMKEMRLKSRSLSVVFVDVDRMEELNRSYRGKAYPTDVLSFSYGEPTVDGRVFLGEIVIAPEIARRGGPDLETELRKLMVHGILHLLGYDHEVDDGEMDRIQSRLMRSRAFATPGRVASAREL
jgi:probable rRNA maturation factor